MNLNVFTGSFRDKPRKNHINMSDLHPAIQQGAQQPSINLKEYSTRNYLFKRERKGFFVSNSGACNLKCPYCITNRPRKGENLDKEDFAYIFRYFGEDIHFVFSGVGDFFCSYPKEDELLRFILRHDVRISYLDINGVDIRELDDPELEGRDKIDLINISYHFSTMKDLKLIQKWTDSVTKIHENGYKYEIKMVASHREMTLWEEAVSFYNKEILPITHKKLILCPDTFLSLETQYDDIGRLADSCSGAVDIYEKALIFRGRQLPLNKTLPCAAGSRYFRVFNDGAIVPCEFLANNFNIKLGNVKKKELITLRKNVQCDYTGFCDCGWAANLGFRALDEREAHSLTNKYAEYKRLRELPLPEEVTDITMNIDRFEEAGKVLWLDGWALIEGSPSAENDICIVLKSDAMAYVFLSEKRIRQDVAAHFNNIDYKESGFSLSVAVASLEPGEYRLGIFIRNAKRETMRYTDLKIVTGLKAFPEIREI